MALSVRSGKPNIAQAARRVPLLACPAGGKGTVYIIMARSSELRILSPELADLSGTRVTPNGIRDLERALPKARIVFTANEEQ